jgi:hypothetical protein
MVFDAIVAPQYKRRHQTEQLLGSPVKRTVPVGLRIKTVKALDFQSGVPHDNLVQAFAFGLKLFDNRFCHIRY